MVRISDVILKSQTSDVRKHQSDVIKISARRSPRYPNEMPKRHQLDTILTSKGGNIN